MIIHKNIKQKLQLELLEAKSIWVATAMISYNGWMFIQENISKGTEQHFLIGIDLSTEPKVFEELLNNLHINSRVYQTNYTFHPKVYLLQKRDNSFTAFIGSSNTTSWGLEKNVEMNFQVNDQEECIKLLYWFIEHYSKGYIITEDFFEYYKSKYVRLSRKKKEMISETQQINSEIAQDIGQFFSRNNHKIFEKKYHRIENEELKRIRKEVWDKFRQIHNIIYPQFKTFGLNELYQHHNKRDIVSRYYFNKFSGYIVNSIWLHYGKSQNELVKYFNGDKSINRPNSFINNIRLQIIIHDVTLGIWLVLGKNNGSSADREYFKNQLQKKNYLKMYFSMVKHLQDYWIDSGKESVAIIDLKNQDQLLDLIEKSEIDNYFIIGKEIHYLDQSISNHNIYTTILSEFQKLYPLYCFMKHS